jgi:hypothetical protein
MDSLSKAAKAVSTAMKAAFAGATIKIINDQIGKLTDAYGKQERAEIRLAAAMRNNPLIDGTAFKRFTEYASQVQKTSIFGDEKLIEMQAFLTTLRMSESQIRDVISAATNLASTGMVTLDSAVRNLARTYGGLSGELGELIPGIRELTEEEMRAGKAVEYINEQYEGMAEAVSKGVAGTKKRVENMIGDIKERIGLMFVPLVENFAKLVDENLPRIEEWINRIGPHVMATLMTIPQALSIAFSTLKSVINELFEQGKWMEFATLVARTMVIAFEALGESIYNILARAFENITQNVGQDIAIEYTKLVNNLRPIAPLDTFRHSDTKGYTLSNVISPQQMAGMAPFRMLPESLKQQYGSAIRDPGIGSTRRLDAAIEAIRAWTRKEAQRQRMSPEDFVARLAQESEDPGKTFVEILGEKLDSSGIGSAWNSEFGFVIDGLEDLGNISNLYAKNLEQANRTFTQSPVVSDILSGAPPAGRGRTPINPATAGMLGPNLSPRPASPNLGDIHASLGQSGLQQVLGRLSGAFGSIVGAIAPLVTSLKSVMALMNPLQTILSAAMQVLGPLIDKVLSPLVGILAVLGQTIGAILAPLLEALSPVIQAVAEGFAWMYNWAIRPFANLLITGFNHLNNAIAGLVNAMLAAWEAVTFWDSKKFTRMEKKDPQAGHLALMDLQTIQTAGTNYLAGEGAFGGAGGAQGAQYTQPRDIYVDVFIEPGAVLVGEGGMRELARTMRTEFERLDILGA